MVTYLLYDKEITRTLIKPNCRANWEFKKKLPTANHDEAIFSIGQ